MCRLALKYIRPTASEHGHTKVYHKGSYLGYFLPNRFSGRRVGENYNFVSKLHDIPGCDASNRKALIRKIRGFVKQSMREGT
jgi:hypothetical protein